MGSIAHFVVSIMLLVTVGSKELVSELGNLKNTGAILGLAQRGVGLLGYHARHAVDRWPSCETVARLANE